MDQICIPGTLVCDGNNVTCNAEGSGHTGCGAPCDSQHCAAGECLDEYLVEDFEVGDYVGWIEGTSSATLAVTSSYAANGTDYSLEMTGSTDIYNDINFEFDDARPTYLSYWCRATKTGSAAYFVLFPPGPTEFGNAIVSVYFRFDEILVATDGDLSLGDATANRWYHIEMDFDWGSKSIDFTIDDVLTASNVPFTDTSGTSVARLDLFRLSSTSSYFDEIIVR